MNYRGSYRRLLGNAQAAMLAAVEIYNKPTFDYRDECVFILLLNAWELMLKALLSKNKQSVYYPKHRNQPYRTLSWGDAYSEAERYLPAAISPLAIRRNLDLLGTYRDNSVHFYNAKDFGLVLYALAQTAVKNFRDVLKDRFDIELENQIHWQLIPIGVRPPTDLVSYLGGDIPGTASSAVRQFLTELNRAVAEVRGAQQDRGRLLTVFDVKLMSVKKIGDADAVVGVGAADAVGPLAIIRNQDPNITHPLRQRDIIARIPRLHGKAVTSYTLQAIAWKHQLKKSSQYCWVAHEGFLTRYSNDTIVLVRNLTAADLEAALTDYRAHLRAQNRRRGVGT